MNNVACKICGRTDVPFRNCRKWLSSLAIAVTSMTPLHASPCETPPPEHAVSPTRPWRVCVSSVAVPPYLMADTMHPGIIERILLQVGQETGLDTVFLRYPTERCRLSIKSGAADAVLAAYTPSNQGVYRFPMKSGSVDHERRIASVNVVWVKRADSPYNWSREGRMVGANHSKLVVGIRHGAYALADPLRALGFKVDDAAGDSPKQLAFKLKHRRIDLAVAIQEEIEPTLADPGLKDLVVLPNAFSTTTYYVVVRPDLPPELEKKIEAWWTAIGRVRELPEYRVK